MMDNLFHSPSAITIAISQILIFHLYQVAKAAGIFRGTMLRAKYGRID
jgi:hypothetical protein